MKSQLIINTITLIACVGLATTLMGCMAALGALLGSSRFRHTVIMLSILNLVLPQFMILSWWLGLFGEAGALRPWLDWNLYSMTGAIWVITLLFWPIPFLCALGSFQKLHQDLYEVDPELRNFQLCRYLLWPAARPALLGGLGIVAILTLNQFNVPSLLQVRTWTSDLFITFSATLEWQEIQRSIVWLVAGSALFLFTIRGNVVRWPSSRNVSRRVSLSSLFHPGIVGFLKSWTALWVLVATILPCLGLISSASTWSELIPAAAAGESALYHSLFFGGLTATAGLLLGLATHRWGFNKLLWILFLLPGCVWGVVFLSVSQQAWFPLRGSNLLLTLMALTLRYAILGWIGARLAMQLLDKDIKDAGMMEIPSALQRFRWLHLPQTGWILGASWYIAFLLTLWDADTLIFVIPPGAETLALRIFNLLHYGHNSQVNALTLLLLIAAVAPYVIWQSWKLCRIIYESRKNRVQLTSWASGTLLCLLASGCNLSSPKEDSTRLPLESVFFEEAIIIGTQGRSPGYFIKPRSLTVDANDFLYVVDMTGRIQKFDSSGQYILQWQMPELERGRPKGMCVDIDGNIVVVEPHYARVNHFTPQGELVRQWGMKGSEEGSLTFPRAVTKLSDGTLAIGEYQTVERVQRFSPDGSTFIGSTGTRGNQNAQFNRPEGLVSNSLDQIYVADSCNHRIQILDADGKWLQTFGSAGTNPGQMSYPYDLVIDQRDHLFVCEFGNSRIQVFDHQFKTLEILGGPGDAPGQFYNPWSIAMDSKGHLYVADSANHRVQKLIRRKSVALINQSKE
ncbi:MAG: hypothetical protein HOH33_11285 [Verrucomicrobia bacterium]|jgi:ABC-type Fe3+ transport system permease subunit/streptogramin lyase|nr:hypothetical protein [Verrucomicrobiota bacterium]